jgi:hypothetical protein
MVTKQGNDRKRVMGIAVPGSLIVAAAVVLVRGGPHWSLEWLLWVALGVCTGLLPGNIRHALRRQPRG